jgi:hypothetical protein
MSSYDWNSGRITPIPRSQHVHSSESLHLCESTPHTQSRVGMVTSKGGRTTCKPGTFQSPDSPSSSGSHWKQVPIRRPERKVITSISRTQKPGWRRQKAPLDPRNQWTVLSSERTQESDSSSSWFVSSISDTESTSSLECSSVTQSTTFI